MDTFHLRIFQRHVRDQCQFLIQSAHQLNAGLTQHNISQVLFAIQNLLNAGANVSKMLWGARGKKSQERKPLRDSIGISDNSPLREVTMRNHFEHIDERIDRWWAESESHNHADGIIGPRNTIAGLEPIETFRWFDPATAEIVFWGESFNIQALVSEAERILPRLQEEAGKPHWEEPDLR